MTSATDNARTGANLTETLLTPENVNKISFGRLFSQPVDYQVLAQPLYVPGVNIAGKGVHNVVFVVTMADSVYAFDADNNTGDNATALWQVNFTDPANGITTATYLDHTLPCSNANSGGPGFNQEGIISTPVIDQDTGTMYLVAKTVENGVVRHRLHALDITNGQEKFGGSVIVQAQSVSNKGKIVDFNSLHQKNRPGLLLLNGTVYLAFGSNYCNDSNTGWIIAYDATTLQQAGAFNTNPDHGLTSIWQSGHGIAADLQGNIYAETAEGNFDLDVGGQGYTNSVLKLSSSPFGLADSFTPSTVSFLNQHDLDMSSTGPVVLPDQDGPHPHEVVASGKQGTIYLMDRDNMGQYNASADQVVQEIPLAVGEMFSSPAYWNGMVYFCGNAGPLRAYALSEGMLSTVPVAMSSKNLTGSHTPSISANGDQDGVLWVVSGGQLWAFDASNLKLIFTTLQAGTRDKLPQLAHFATQTVADGKVFIATRNSVEVLGLFHLISTVSGDNQAASAGTQLPLPIQVMTAHAYSNEPIAGVTVTFSDGGKGGSFDPPQGVTDDSGLLSTVYTLPLKTGTYTLTASATGFADHHLTATALPNAPARIVAFGGNQQTGTVGTALPKPLTVQVQDANKNGVPGVSVTFVDNGQGAFSPQATVVTDAAGKASVVYTLPANPGKYSIKVSSDGLKTISFTEFAQ